MKKTGLALIFLVATSFSTWAGTTADDAARLQAALQAHLGTAPEALKLLSDGDGYKAVFDFSSSLAAAKAEGADVAISPIEFHLMPDGAGKWKVSHQGPFNFSFKVKGDVAFQEKMDSFTFMGTYDEALGTFADYDLVAKNLTIFEVITDPKSPNGQVEGKFDSISAKGVAVAKASGGADVQFSQTIGASMFHSMIFDKDKKTFDIQIKFSGADYSGAIIGAQTSAVAPILKFLAQHPDKGTMVKDQQAFKVLLTALLPIFNNLQGQGTLKNFEVNMPAGSMTIDKITTTLKLNGAIKQGHFEPGLSVEGLTLPPGLIPAWAASLVPKNTSFNIALTGFDAETPTKAWLKTMDFSKNPPISPDVVDGLVANLIPQGDMDVTITQTGLNNALYNFTADATFKAGPKTMPNGKAHVTFKGLDDVLKVVLAAPPDAGMKGSVETLIAARDLAKTSSDGSMTWDVQASSDGKIIVNGIDVSKGKK